MPKLAIEGKPLDIYLRKEPYDEDNERRGRTNDNGTWYDKGILFKLRINPAFQDVEAQVREFYRSFKTFILNKHVKALLIDAMYSGMSSNKLVKKLEKDDADYWKLWKSVDPSIKMMDALDEVMCNDGIKLIVQTIFKKETKRSSQDLSDEAMADLFFNEDLPLDIAALFAD